MEKIVDLQKSVQALCAQFPDLAQTLADLGFTEITRPGMLQTAGRFMTIPKGAKLKNLSLEEIKAGLLKQGYGVVDGTT